MTRRRVHLGCIRGRKGRRPRKPVSNLSTLAKKMKASGVKPDPPHWQDR